VIDGLRPDAITPERMPVLSDMVSQGWQAPRAVTVRPLAGALLRLGGVTRLVADASAPAALFDAAVRRIDGNKGRELVVVYANDPDLAGHAWGWMSRAYLEAARTVDRALARILPLLSDLEALISVSRGLCNGACACMKQPPRPTPRIERPGPGNTGTPVSPGNNSLVPSDDEIFRDPFADFAPSSR
jgi:hypothetical protein